MSISLEALAMAGEDYVNYGIDMEEWERADLEETPAHLLADDEVGHSEQQFNLSINYNEERIHYYEGCKSSRNSLLRLRELIIMISAMIRLTMLIKVENIVWDIYIYFASYLYNVFHILCKNCYSRSPHRSSLRIYVVRTSMGSYAHFELVLVIIKIYLIMYIYLLILF